MVRTTLAAGMAVSLFLFSACSSPPPAVVEDTIGFDNSSNEELLRMGIEALSKNATVAIKSYFDPVIQNCRASFPNGEEDDEHRFYAARTPAESLYYLVQAAAENQQASVVRVPCAAANYLKGYASVDLGDLEAAADHLRQALRWSPVHALYLSELGHVQQINRDWQTALELFEKAEEYAEMFSPEEEKLGELARAKRGIGFALIEMGELDEAEQKFTECLQIDGADEKAKQELAYIKQLRER